MAMQGLCSMSMEILREDMMQALIPLLTLQKIISGDFSPLMMLQVQQIVYGPDTTMQAMLSDRYGRVLLIEPGIGYRLEQRRYSLMTNYSVLNPESTRPYIVPGDDRYEQAKAQLEKQKETFSVSDAFCILNSVKQEGLWATRVTFVYSVKENKVYYVLNNRFEEITEYSFHS